MELRRIYMKHVNGSVYWFQISLTPGSKPQVTFYHLLKLFDAFKKDFNNIKKEDITVCVLSEHPYTDLLALRIIVPASDISPPMEYVEVNSLPALAK